MFSNKKSFSDTRAIVYALAMLLALTGFKFGHATLALGLFQGVAMSWVWRVSSDGEDVPLALSLLVVMIGLALLAWGLVLARAHGVSLHEIHRVPALGRFARSLEIRSLSTLAAGAFLVLANVFGKRAAPPD
jgi:hypothetical protein